MKSSSYRSVRALLAGLLFVTVAFSPIRSLLSSPTNAAPAPAAASAPAPSGGGETDPETHKPIVTTPSGLKYVDIVVGTGAAVQQGDTVAVNYVGKLLDGTKFDASADHGGPFTYQQGITGLIPGWVEGTSTMKVGGKRKLIIPPQLDYGSAGAGDAVPPNATLIFEIEVVSATH